MCVSWAGDAGVAVAWVGWGAGNATEVTGLPARKPLKDTCGQRGDSEQIMHWRLDTKRHF